MITNELQKELIENQIEALQIIRNKAIDSDDYKSAFKAIDRIIAIVENFGIKK